MRIKLSDHFTLKRLLKFVFPSIIMMIIISIYGVIDGFFVSNYVGKSAFSSLNLVMPFIMILGGMGFMIGTGGSALVSKTLGQKENEKAALEKMKLDLYPDWKNGDLTREEYQQLRADFDRRIAGLDEMLVRLRKEIEQTGRGMDGSNAFLSAFLQYRNLEKLNREVVVELIDAIYVHEDGSLTIQFRFEDAFEQAVQYIRQNQQLADTISV